MEGNETGGKETSWEAVEMKTTLAKIVQWGWREVDSFKKVDLTDANEECVGNEREGGVKKDSAIFGIGSIYLH